MSCTFRSVLELLPNSSGTPNPAIVPGATGNRNNASGALGGIGVEGTALSSSPLASGRHNAGRLIFNADFVGPFHGTYRAYALSVRCVQASADRKSVV